MTNGVFNETASAELPSFPFPVTIGHQMSCFWLRFTSSCVGCVAALTVAACGMRTLDLVDERTSTTGTEPAEAAVPDVTDSTVVASSAAPSTNTSRSSSSGPASTSADPPPPPRDAGGSELPDAGGQPCNRDDPNYDPFSGTCLECRYDGECPNLQGGVVQVCQWGGYCDVPCQSNTECRYALLCNGVGKCVECLSNVDCAVRFGDARPLCQAQGRCAECLSDLDCGGFKPKCDTFYNWCREECTSNLHCGIDEPVCDLGTLTCRGCVTDRECPPDAPVCGNFGRCMAGPQNESSAGGP